MIPADARTVRRPAATFKIRRRALSPERQERFDRSAQRWGLAEFGPLLDWHEVFDVFGRRDRATVDVSTDVSVDVPTNVVLDIGFGHGESVLHRMFEDTGVAIVGVEVHTPGVAAVFEAIEAAGVDTVRVVHGDAVTFLDRVPASSLAEVHILFPDPWPKTRHHHRRLVGGDVIAAVTDRLRIGGLLHLATDIVDYADVMRAACAGDPRLVGGTVDRPTNRPVTRFEQRGLDEGRTVVDLRYRRAD